jgi:hypothetical protein
MCIRYGSIKCRNVHDPEGLFQLLTSAGPYRGFRVNLKSTQMVKPWIGRQKASTQSRLKVTACAC